MSEEPGSTTSSATDEWRALAVRQSAERVRAASQAAAAAKPRLGRPANPAAAAAALAAFESRAAAERAALAAALAARGEDGTEPSAEALAALAAPPGAPARAAGGGAGGAPASARASTFDPEAARAAAQARSRDGEMSIVSSRVRTLGLAVHEVVADGNCLFRAAAHQLALLARRGGARGGGAPGGEGEAAHRELRRRAATFIRLHAEEFAPFLPYLPGDGYPEAPEAAPGAARLALERYCERLASSSSWGGHPELRALAGTLGVPIVVHQAEGAPWRFAPVAAEDGMLRGGGGADDYEDALRLSFHRFYHARYEHYNSLVPAEAAAAAGAAARP